MRLTGLEGKVAVVTGAGRMRSIGREIAVAFAKAGCDVVVTGTGRSRDRMLPDETEAGWRDIESVAEEVGVLGRRAVPVVCDVSDERQVDALAERCIAELGRVDFLVNNAGAPMGSDRKPVTELDTPSWQRVIDTNLTGVFLMSRRFGALMERAEAGVIVNMSSIAGKAFPPYSAAYAASKAGVQALTACMAQEIGPAGVRVNAICPGYVETSRLDGIARGDAWTATIASIPLRRAGVPADIASAVLFLCSDQGSWVTGQAWNVDGGHVMQH